MTPDEAEWVRANVWTQYMCENYYPGTHTCACQTGPSDWCITDRHTWRRPKPRPDYETLILDRQGLFPAWLPGPFHHPAPYPCNTDEHRQNPLARVWLADRLCRRLCPCVCHTSTRPPAALEPETVPRTSWTYELVELPLFDLLPA